MNKKTIFFKIPYIILLSFVSLTACDEDFNEIDSNVLGEGNTSYSVKKETLSVVAYNKKLAALQIDNLQSNLLGVYKDPAFGTTTASIITQVTPTTFSPDFGTNPQVTSVVLRIPYFSRVDGIDQDANLTYSISDSIYGEEFDGTVHPIDITIFENTYFLRDVFNPALGLNGTLNYYSKAEATSNTIVSGEAIVSGVDAEINLDSKINTIDTLLVTESLTPSNLPKVINVASPGEIEEEQRFPPQIYYELDKDFWQNLLMDASDKSFLSSANAFRSHFKGIFIKAEMKDDNGTMILLDLDAPNADITVNYTNDELEEGEEDLSYVLNFFGNRVNTFINNFDITLNDGDKNNGDEKLYLKGLEGSMAVVDLFPKDLFPDETALENFKNEYRESDGNGGYKFKRLINDVQLVVYEDETMSNNGNEDQNTYNRIYAYDIKNNTPLIDYSLDLTDNLQAPIDSKVLSLGKRIEGEDGSYKYKIRLTEHFKNIILNDSTNTKIGLVLSSNVNNTSNSKILNSGDEVTAVPSTSIITPRGTVLYGNSSANPDKKIRLDIFFKESN